jgi:hypothetical protein
MISHSDNIHLSQFPCPEAEARTHLIYLKSALFLYGHHQVRVSKASGAYFSPPSQLPSHKDPFFSKSHLHTSASLSLESPSSCSPPTRVATGEQPMHGLGLLRLPLGEQVG